MKDISKDIRFKTIVMRDEFLKEITSEFWVKYEYDIYGFSLREIYAHRNLRLWNNYSVRGWEL